MGARGPAPKPTALRLAEGNPSSRPLPKNEPKPAPYMPSVPPHLMPQAKIEWRRISKELHKLGLLTKVDRAALAAYCQLYGRWVQAERELGDDRPLITYTEKGYPVSNPLLGVVNSLLSQMHRYMSEFGLTPASRTRLAIIPDADDKKTPEERRAARLLGA